MRRSLNADRSTSPEDKQNNGTAQTRRGGGTANWFLQVSSGLRSESAAHDGEDEELLEVHAQRAAFPAAETTDHESVAVIMLDAEEQDPFDEQNHHYDVEDQVLLAAAAHGLAQSDDKEDDEPPKADDTAYALLVKRSEEQHVAAQARKSAFEREAQRKKDRKKQARMNTKMRISFATKTLSSKIVEGRLYSELFVYVPFLIMFIFLFLTSASTEEAYWTKAQLGDQFTTGQLPTLESYTWTLNPEMPKAYHISFILDQVRNAQDWHFWYQTQALDFIWGQDDVNLQELSNSFIQGANMKFGAVRFRALRMNNHSCGKTPVNFNFVNMQDPGLPDPRTTGACYGPFDSSQIDRSSYSRPGHPNLMKYIDCQAASQQVLFGYVDNYPCVGQAVELPAMWSHEQARAIFELLKGQIGGGLGTVSGADIVNGYALDDLLFHPLATRAVIVEMFTYLPFIDAFQSYKVLTEITTGGRMVHSGTVTTFQIWSLARSIDYVTTFYFFIFYVFVFYYVYKFVYNIVEAVHKDKLPELVTDFWNFWDLVNLLCFMAVFVCRIVWMRQSYLLNASELLTATAYDDRLDFIALMYTLQVWLNGVNTIISFLKILKFVDLNPTLNIVTRTISRAQQSLFGVLVIFVIIIVSYGICGVAIFSNGLDDFRDLSTAMSTLMRMLIGDFDYIALRDESRVAAPLFFWSFMILGLFLILNFLIGIILEAFEDETDETRADPIPVLVRRFVQSIKAVVLEFYDNPKAFMTARRERKNHRFAVKSRLATTVEQLTQYRMMLIVDDFSLAELEQMTEAELEALLPDDLINRYDLENIFLVADPLEGAERAAWVGPKYMDQLWELCVRNYYVHRLGEADEEAKQLWQALEDAAEDALAFVMGVGSGRGTDRETTKPMVAPGVEKFDEDDLAADSTVTRKPSQAAKAAYRAEHNRREQLTAVRQLFKPVPETVQHLKDVERNLRKAHDEGVVILRSLLRELPSTAADPALHAPEMSHAAAMEALHEHGNLEAVRDFARVSRAMDEWSEGTGATQSTQQLHAAPFQIVLPPSQRFGNRLEDDEVELPPEDVELHDPFEPDKPLSPPSPPAPPPIVEPIRIPSPVNGNEAADEASAPTPTAAQAAASGKKTPRGTKKKAAGKTSKPRGPPEEL